MVHHISFSGSFAPRFMRRGPWVACLIALVAHQSSGCGGNGNRPKTAQVSGKVMYDGKPVETGSLLFVPNGGGAPAQGNIESDGSYRLGTFTETDGATLGEFKVMITAWTQPKGGPGLPEDAIRGDAGPISLIPEIYGDLDKSGLTATVKDEDNTIDFNLEKKAPLKKAPAKKAADVPKIGSL